MFELNYAVEKVEARTFAAAPTLDFHLHLTCSQSERQIQNVLLQCQLQIAATRRRYSAEEQQRLVELFGTPDRWSQTLGSLLWTHADVTVPPFRGETRAVLPVPCTFDFNVAATKYFHGLEAGVVPVLLLFSGSIFYTAENGALQVVRVPWQKEAAYQLPVQVWKEMMDHYYPQSAWLCLARETFDRLKQYKEHRSIPTWDGAIESLLQEAAVPPPAATKARSRFGIRPEREGS